MASQIPSITRRNMSALEKSAGKDRTTLNLSTQNFQNTPQQMNIDTTHWMHVNTEWIQLHSGSKTRQSKQQISPFSSSLVSDSLKYTTDISAQKYKIRL